MLFALACSSGTEENDGGSGEETGDDALIVPEGLSVTALAGGNGVLDMVALTLRNGPSSTELYAALRNDGDIPACHAALSVELFDESEQSLASGIGGLLTQHFYRLTDGSGTIAACVAPGGVTMAAVTDLPSDLAVEDVRYIVYRCPYFALDVVGIDGLDISQVKRVTGGAGTAYTGILVNGLDVVVSNPSVTVFAVNRVGRPLGVATGSSTDEIPPGGSWAFETNTLSGTVPALRGGASSDAPAFGHAAYPAGAFAN